MHIIQLVKSLPPAEQRMVCTELVKHTAQLGLGKRRQLQRLADGAYCHPDGIPNDDPVFKVLEKIEEERHRTPGPPPPEFD